MTFDKIFEIIDRVSSVIPVDLYRVCSELGVHLQAAQLHPDIVGQIENKDDQFVISYNLLNSSNGYRHRFTIAHEIGHYVLHKHLIGSGVDDNKAFRSTNTGMYNNSSITQRHEAEANHFAASLLMPEHILRNDAKYMSTFDLACKYQVSEQAMSYRLQNLGILTQPALF